MVSTNIKAKDFIRCKVLLAKLDECRYMTDSEKAELASLMSYFWVHPFTEEEKAKLKAEHGIEVNDELEKVLQKYWK